LTAKHRRCTLATMKTLGARIRELRDEKDLSTRELAKKAQISIAMMSDIELGRRQPSEKVLAAIAKPLGTTLEDLQQYDPRPAVEEFKRRIQQDPQYGYALRRVMNSNLSAEEIVKLIEENTKKKKK
jgi:transcriptional regulator with XRE-family HTH domain